MTEDLRLKGFHEMTDINSPRGLISWNIRRSSPNSGGLETFYVPSTDAVAIYRNQLLSLTGETDAYGKAIVAYSNGGESTTHIGVMTGVSWRSVETQVPLTDEDKNYRPASRAMYIQAEIDPDQVYMIQANATLDGVDFMYKNAALDEGTADTTSGESRDQVDVSTLSASNTFPLKVIGLAPIDGNVPNSLYPKLLVKLNRHYDRIQTGV